MKTLPQERTAQAEKLIREIMLENAACGIAACIIDSDGNTVYEQYFGSRKTDQRSRMPDPDGQC